MKSWLTPRRPDFTAIFPLKVANPISWVVAMSYGFIIQLLVQPDALRSLNRFMEQKAWGAFRYEIYPSYDFRPIAEKFKKEHS
jgi:hypothetical protein